jgi:hypothetical protein
MTCRYSSPSCRILSWSEARRRSLGPLLTRPRWKLPFARPAGPRKAALAGRSPTGMSAGVEITCRVYKPPPPVSTDAIGRRPRRCTRSCGITSRRSTGRSAMGRLGCGSPSTPARSWRATSIAGSSAGVLLGFCARTAGRGGWWHSVARAVAFARRAPDGGLLGRLTRIAVETVLTFYAARTGEEGRPGAKSGAVTAVQRTSSDLRLNPHLQPARGDRVSRRSLPKLSPRARAGPAGSRGGLPPVG